MGALDGFQLTGGTAVVAYLAIVAHVDAAVLVAAGCRGAGSDDGADDVHDGLHVVAARVVAVAVDEDAGLATVDTGLAEVGQARAVTPVGTGIDRLVDCEGIGADQGRHGGHVATGGTRFEEGVGIGLSLDGLGPHGALVDGVDTNVDVGRATDDALVAAAVDRVADGAGRHIDDRGGALGGGSGIDALSAVAVAHVGRAAVDRGAHDAAVHVEHLQSVDQCVAADAARGAGEDVVVEDAAVHVDDDVAVLLRVGVGGGRGHQGVGDLLAAAVEHVGSLGVLLVAEGGAQLAAAVEVAREAAVVDFDVHIFGVGHLEALSVGVAAVVGGVGAGFAANTGNGAVVFALAAHAAEAVASAVDVAVSAAIDDDIAGIDVAGEVVAAIDVAGGVEFAGDGGLAGLGHTVELHVGGTLHVAAPAAAVDGVEGLCPGGVDGDIGVVGVAATAAAVGGGAAQV